MEKHIWLVVYLPLWNNGIMGFFWGLYGDLTEFNQQFHDLNMM